MKRSARKPGVPRKTGVASRPAGSGKERDADTPSGAGQSAVDQSRATAKKVFERIKSARARVPKLVE